MRVQSLCAAVDAVAAAAPSRLAVRSPFQAHAMDYATLRGQSLALAHALSVSLSYQPGDVLLSDLPNITENLLVQLACARLGVAMATVKDTAALSILQQKVGVERVRGAVVSSPSSSFLSTVTLRHPPIMGGDEASSTPWSLPRLLQAKSRQGTLFTPPTVDLDSAWGFFNSTSPLTHREGTLPTCWHPASIMLLLCFHSFGGSSQK
jgi:hypothetical protein